MNPDKGSITGETERFELWGTDALRAKVRIVYELGNEKKYAGLKMEVSKHKMRR